MAGQHATLALATIGRAVPHRQRSAEPGEAPSFRERRVVHGPAGRSGRSRLLDCGLGSYRCSGRIARRAHRGHL